MEYEDTFAVRILHFITNLDFDGSLPEGIKIMNAYRESENVKEIVKSFYTKYYNNNNPRRLILGINPGRFGAGVTGITFTDTKRLKEKCGITANHPETHEPSSVFIYDVIDAYGGAEKFYADFYVDAVCPLGFTQIRANGKEVNYNYYDSKELLKAIYPFITASLKKKLEFGIDRETCFCLGTGKNYKFLSELNRKYNFFRKIIPLEHPRFIMQYKSKQKQFYIKKYLEFLTTF